VRSEGDTWDITTSVGSTALFVATARALEAQKPDPLAVDPYAELFCRAVGGPSADVLDGKDPDHPLKTDDFGQHFINFQGARTKYFDEYFRRGPTPACARWSSWRLRALTCGDAAGSGVRALAVP
jgi:O-methyltransferase involved in polyketide biosynthesis